MGGRVVRVGEAHRIVGAVVQQELIAKCQDATFSIKRTLDVVELVAAVRRADEMFAAILNPFHRAAQLKRQERDKNFLRIYEYLVAESAADIRRNHADGFFGKIQL